ncbi:MAG: hypothetical protein IJC57_02080 [Clostridia bacterium]|nr:hypothetical protein [Clostridia bacterium]
MQPEVSKKSTKKRWIISLVIALLAGLVGYIIYYFCVPRVFTRAEYIKEVVIQNRDFEKSVDKFLDQVISYNGTKESLDNLKNSASKFTEFVEELEKKLKPKVPNDSKKHYEQMISAYNIYLEAIDMYLRYTPKALGDERNELLKQAGTKLTEARDAMKNITNN